MIRSAKVHTGKETEKEIRKGAVAKRKKKEKTRRIQVDLTREAEAEAGAGAEVDLGQNHLQNLFRYRIQNIRNPHSHTQEIKSLIKYNKCLILFLFI